MDKAGMGDVQKENRFTWIEDPKRTQRLIDKQVTVARPALPGGIARA
jgi:hypothetical protein